MHGGLHGTRSTTDDLQKKTIKSRFNWPLYSCVKNVQTAQSKGAKTIYRIFKHGKSSSSSKTSSSQSIKMVVSHRSHQQSRSKVLLQNIFTVQCKVLKFTWNENWKNSRSSRRRIHLKHHVRRTVVKTGFFLYERVLLYICGGAFLNCTWCCFEWTRYSFLPTPSEERLAGQVCFTETAQTSQIGKSFISFENFQAKFRTSLGIFWSSIFLSSW